MLITAAYDPADDKIRLSASQRLDSDTYAKVKAGGYGWAPKQGVFYAVWSPRREDIALELAGEIGDEDTTLVERAEERAERFEGYQENRTTDAQRAREAVSRIADGIPMGQPILVGHHSEKHARKDAEKIENGMRRAVKMWDTAQYWERRAAGALAHARYKELPAVRARRIKTIEAEMRSMVADYTPHAGQPPIIQDRSYYNGFRYRCNGCVEPHYQIGYRHEMACTVCAGKDWTEAPERVPHVWTGPKGRGGRWVAADCIKSIKARHARSIAHCEMRLLYERAMLAEGGGLVADKFAFAVGGRAQGRGEWFVVTGINRRDGAVMSLSIAGHFAATLLVEEITDYREPAEGDAEKVKAAVKLPPMMNYRAPRCIEMTMEEWKRCTRHSDSYFAGNFDAEGNHTWGWVKDGEKPIAYRQRSKVSVGSGYHRVPVFITDAPVKEPKAVAERPRGVLAGMLAELPRETRVAYQRPERTEFDGLREALKAGVQVVSAPQLFPTPAALARRMVEMSGLQAGETVLEPSAGTGAIVKAVIEAVDTEIVGYDINRDLVSHLTRTFPSYKLQARCCDFLDVTDGQGQFQVVLMNPPFANAVDIRHIKHALSFVKPGGCLVAVCANGPRQNEQLKPLCEIWEPLPAGTFSESGTEVFTVLLRIRG